MTPTRDDLSILAVISVTSLHGYGVACQLRRLSSTRASTLGSVYPTLHALEYAGWIKSEWVTSDQGRRARYYSLTTRGRHVLRHGPRSRYYGRNVSAAFLCGIAVTAFAPQEPAALPRVRSTSPFIRTLLSRGASDSQRFRQLVDQISHTNGIVYVEDGRCGHAVNACLTLSVTLAGGFRFLKVVLKAGDTNERTKTNDLIATIGHELQHAVEVLTNPRIDTSYKMFHFYMNESSIQSGGHFETVAAVNAGDQIERELSRTGTTRRAASSAESITGRLESMPRDFPGAP
jgi:PadR family transcriptional regulator